MQLRLHRCPEESHHRVADVLVEGAAAPEDDVRHRGEVFVEELDQVGGGELLGDPGEPADVGEHHGQVHLPAAELEVLRLF